MMACQKSYGRAANRSKQQEGQSDFRMAATLIFVRSTKAIEWLCNINARLVTNPTAPVLQLQLIIYLHLSTKERKVYIHEKVKKNATVLIRLPLENKTKN